MRTRGRRLAACLVALAVLPHSTASRAQSVPDVPEQEYEEWAKAALNSRGERCEFHAVRSEGRRAFLACGASGLWEVETDASSSPRLVRSYDLGGDVVGFLSDSDGRAWVRVNTVQAHPLESIASREPTPPPSEAPHGPNEVQPSSPLRPREPSAPSSTSETAGGMPKRLLGAPGAAQGHVLRVGNGYAIISIGAAQGIEEGQRVDFSTSRPEDLGVDEAAVERKHVASGRVTGISTNHAKVQLGFNERVSVGSLAVASDRPFRPSLSGPPRLGDHWSAQGIARTFVALGEFGGGLLLSGTLSYQFEQQLRLLVFVDPIAVADADVERGVAAVNGGAVASFDTRFFELGLGLGAQTVNSTDFGRGAGSGLSVVQTLRLGVEDGLNLTARTSIVLFHKEFDLGSLVVSAQIPVREGYWLLLGGGGGNVGYGLGEVGLRALLDGNGDRGSTFLRVSAGGAAIFTDGACEISDEFGSVGCDDSVNYAGPMAGVGVEWRF